LDEGTLPDDPPVQAGPRHLALSAILIAMGYWRRTESFSRHAYTGNVVAMATGFLLMGYQLAGYFIMNGL
jgi:hypothetical protein